jgi:hypothetical protein
MPETSHSKESLVDLVRSRFPSCVCLHELYRHDVLDATIWRGSCRLQALEVLCNRNSTRIEFR